MATKYEYCVERCQTRDRKVPEHVVERMYKNFDPPYWYEGWDDINIVFDTKSVNSNDLPVRWLDTVKNFNQENSHHSLTLGQHCRKAWQYICQTYAYADKHLPLRIATILHDCGKPFCKTFKNSKGEITEQAHYYSHEHTGSYDSLFYVIGFL